MKSGSAWKVAGLAGLVMACCGTAQARQSSALDRISFWIGGSSMDATATLEADTVPANGLDKLDLGTGDQTIGHARLDLLLFDAQGLTFDYYSVGRDKTNSYSGEFNFQGIPFDLEASLHTKLNVDIGSASWRWWFGSDTDVFGIGLGGAYYRASLKLNGAANIEGEQLSQSARWSDSAVAPVLTLAYKHAFSDSFRLYADAGGLKKNGGTLSGHIYDVRAGLEWFPWTNVGLAAEYGKSKLSLRRDSDEQYNAALNTDFHGPSLFLRLRF